MSLEDFGAVFKNSPVKSSSRTPISFPLVSRVPSRE